MFDERMINHDLPDLASSLQLVDAGLLHIPNIASMMVHVVGLHREEEILKKNIGYIRVPRRHEKAPYLDLFHDVDTYRDVDRDIDSYQDTDEYQNIESYHSNYQDIDGYRDYDFDRLGKVWGLCS
ncbi:hypothetical protein AMTR_s00006p00262310 [Amborella trichopoda]|uniref:Uncharacterized protein n=1 Tax=Amborella trichopoda TaxID=13333 RepID=W1P7I8_AMBTC|nr:hypothetical protein AMTR_s00006p00262310 [Amborella trichopoda]